MTIESYDKATILLEQRQKLESLKGRLAAHYKKIEDRDSDLAVDLNDSYNAIGRLIVVIERKIEEL